MIDKAEFLTGLTVLAGAFGREVDGGIQVAYYRALSPKMTTEQFQKAVNETLVTETFWPSPAVLLGKIKSADELKALDAFEHVNRVVGAAGGYRFFPHERFMEFDAPTRAAISACGGLHEMANVSEERYGSLAKKFATAYAKSLEAPVALPATGTDNRVTGLVRGVSRNLALVDYKNRAAGEGVEP